jgi:hypothetical protein
MVKTLQQNLTNLDADEYEVLRSLCHLSKTSTIKPSTKCDNTTSTTANTSITTTPTTN